MSLPADHRGGVLTVAERHHDGWTARIDGEPTTPIRANLVQLGLLVPEGAERVELEFVAPGAADGLKLGLSVVRVSFASSID